MTGVDVVATAQTGTGKTLAFLLPILQRLITEKPEAEQAPAMSSEGHKHPQHHDRNRKSPVAIRSLILAPTRELALQIAESFGKLSVDTGLRCAVVVGGLSEQTQLSALRRGVQVVIATPGRLEDFLDRRLIDLRKVSTVVLDEADRMLDMGFLPAIENILSELPKERQSLFFSATMEMTVERLIKRHSNNPVRIACANSTAQSTPERVDLHLYEIENDMKIHLLRHLLNEEEGSFLVFARTKHGTDRLSNRLASYGVKAATDVAARGIHVDSVAHVVNFDLPQAPQDFIHRVGRTGRAGQRGSASTFCVRGERGEIKRIERECKITLLRSQVSPDTLKQLSEMPMQERSAAPVVVSRPPAGHHNNRGRFDGRSENGGGNPSRGKSSFSRGPKRNGAGAKPSYAAAK
jgi:ATP-dependent RNA helicase RhlE